MQSITRKVLFEKELPEGEKESFYFEDMSVFKEAALRELCGYGYFAHRSKIIWRSKKCSWCFFGFSYGIRLSERNQFFPIWNVSNNCQRALMFGFWKLYVQIIYTRAESFNQSRKLLLRHRLWKFYQLVS